jgi:hypothetical protein
MVCSALASIPRISPENPPAAALAVILSDLFQARHAPTGATIDPASGAFTWTLSGTQAPGVYPVTVRVSDDGTPNLDDYETINITVLALPMTITDTTSTTASNDGTINEGEYVGSTYGINSGFGGVIGSGSSLHVDSSSAGGLNFGLIQGAGTYNDAMVIYIDVDRGGTGFSGTGTFTDTGDGCRRAISGYDGTNRSILDFAPGFNADYAICMDTTFAGLFKLVGGGSHTYVGSVNRTTVTGGHYEMDLSLADLELGSGSSFDYVATYLNPTNASRSDEFNGVASYSGGNPGYTTVDLAAGDYHTFNSATGSISPVANGGLGPGGVAYTDGSSSLELWLRADRGATTDTGCTTAANNSEDVVCWKDQSGNGEHVTQDTAGRRPTYTLNAYNSQPALSYTGGVDGDVLTRSFAPFNGDQAYNIFVTFNPSNNNGENLFAIGIPAIRQNIAYQTNTGVRALYHFNDDLDVSGTISGWQLAAFSYARLDSGTDRYYYANSSLAGSN